MQEGASNINPIALGFLLVMALFVLCGERRKAVGAFLITAAFIPLGQQLVVGPLHFHFFRLLILCGFARVMIHGEMQGFQTNKIDKLIIAISIAGFVFGLMREFSVQSIISNLGISYNTLGTYFLVRFLIKDNEEFASHLRVLALIGVVVAASMTIEMLSHRNPFYILGGVDEFATERDGRYRCQGPFRNPILAGTFGATLFPLMVGLWFQDRPKFSRALLGIAGAILIVYASGSSGPLLSFGCTLIAFALWKWRFKMHLFRRGIVAMLILLAMLMKAPIWFIIARISDITGGTGWHRSYLIDVFIKHFNEWWLIGTSYTAHWGPAGQVLAVNPNMMDITNHYVAQGIAGGIWQLALFIALIVCCYQVIGRLVHSEPSGALENKLLWAVGVSLTAHCVSFISISYFDQIEVFWFYLIAVISVLSLPVTEVVAAEIEEEPENEQKPSYVCFR
jgi:hypothetical protein